MSGIDNGLNINSSLYFHLSVVLIPVVLLLMISKVKYFNDFQHSLYIFVQARFSLSHNTVLVLWLCLGTKQLLRLGKQHCLA